MYFIKSAAWFMRPIIQSRKEFNIEFIANILTSELIIVSYSMCMYNNDLQIIYFSIVILAAVYILFNLFKYYYYFYYNKARYNDLIVYKCYIHERMICNNIRTVLFNDFLIEYNIRPNAFMLFDTFIVIIPTAMISINEYSKCIVMNFNFIDTIRYIIFNINTLHKEIRMTS